MTEAIEKKVKNILDNDRRIWDKVCKKAAEVGHGRLECTVQVHQGRIVYADVAVVAERFRAES